MSQDRSESLDEDKLGEEYPPEEPLGVDEYGTTPAEERWDEPIAERVAREEPERKPVDPDAVDLVAPDEGRRPDQEKDAVASTPREDPNQGPLSEEDGVADDPDTRDVANERTGPPPAEEAAIHLTDEG